MNPVLTPSDFNNLLSELKKYVNKPIEPPMSMREAMKFIGAARSSMNRYMDLGMPFHRLNGRPVFYASEINEWIKSQRK